MDLNRRIAVTRAALLGQAVGDAFGVPVEFLSRAEVRAIDPREMLGADTSPVSGSRWGETIPRGAWSDDTSMTLASMASFVSHGGGIDWEDQMDSFDRWWDGGAYCCLDFPFGLGTNVSAAMARHRRGVPARLCGGRRLMDNGNGALMRILPFSLYCVFRDLDTAETAALIGDASAITHGHDISRLSCFLWTELLRGLIGGAGAAEAVARIEALPCGRWFSPEALHALAFVTEGRTRALTEQDIGETGYVADTLYAALWGLLRSGGYEECLRAVVGLGYDTDTAGAVAGMAAGVLWGEADIPARWLAPLKKRALLERAAEAFAGCVGAEAGKVTAPAFPEFRQ